MPLKSQLVAWSKDSVGACLKRDRVISESVNNGVTICAPSLYACSAIFLTRGSDSKGAVIKRFCPFCRPTPLFIAKLASLSIFSSLIFNLLIYQYSHIKCSQFSNI